MGWLIMCSLSLALLCLLRKRYSKDWPIYLFAGMAAGVDIVHLLARHTNLQELV
jgi:hypothetical protein